MGWKYLKSKREIKERKEVSVKKKDVTLPKAKIMNRKLLIGKLKNKIDRLPDNNIQEMDDFADLLLSKIDDKVTVEGIEKLVQDSNAFLFLKEDEDLYTVNDLKEKYK